MVLSDRSIREEIDAGRIIIDPLGENAIQPASVDVHLDRGFLVFRNSRLPLRNVNKVLDEKPSVSQSNSKTVQPRDL